MRSRSASKGSSRKLAPLRGLGKTSFANVKKSKAPLTKGWVDEEIESESDDSADERVTEKKKGKPGSSNEMEDGDSEEIDDLEELNETADQKRRR